MALRFWSKFGRAARLVENVHSCGCLLKTEHKFDWHQVKLSRIVGVSLVLALHPPTPHTAFFLSINTTLVTGLKRACLVNRTGPNKRWHSNWHELYSSTCPEPRVLHWITKLNIYWKFLHNLSVGVASEILPSITVQLVTFLSHNSSTKKVKAGSLRST